MRYLYLLLAIVFLLFTYWQFNDDDPILWVPIYLTAFYISFRAYQGHVNKELILVLIFLGLAAALNSYTQMTAWEGLITQGLSMKSHNQELGREALGLVICVAAFVLAYFKPNR